MGIVQIGCASFFFSYGIKRITAIRTMLTSTIEPVLSPLWVFLATGEAPDVWAVTGGTIIVSAVLFSALMGRIHNPFIRPGQDLSKNFSFLKCSEGEQDL
jgi:drug/metabolite transporter (DMT)-like permease